MFDLITEMGIWRLKLQILAIYLLMKPLEIKYCYIQYYANIFTTNKIMNSINWFVIINKCWVHKFDSNLFLFILFLTRPTAKLWNLVSIWEIAAILKLNPSVWPRLSLVPLFLSAIQSIYSKAKSRNGNHPNHGHNRNNHLEWDFYFQISPLLSSSSHLKK